MKRLIYTKVLVVFIIFALGSNILFGINKGTVTAAAIGVQPLTIQGENFVDPEGKPVRFWGFNIVSLYPTHAQADKLAANLASLEVNVVRPHHNLRNSLDWNAYNLGALVTYSGNSRQFNLEALDRFDYLNAKLRENGIYMRLSLESSRFYLPGDVDILQTNSTDVAAWQSAMTELNKLPSGTSRDLKKLLPTIDERVALINEEFTRNLLNHVNPYTGIKYKDDPMLLTLEIVNESSTEYAIICGNKFDPTNTGLAYWNNVLIQKWNKYTSDHGVAACDLYAPSTTAQKQAKSAFLQELDVNYFNRMKTLIRDLGCQTPITFSNLWRGESALKINDQMSDYNEDHAYVDPFIAKTSTDVNRPFDDLFAYTNKTMLQNKPFFMGELNQSEGDANIAANKSYRTMLPLASAAYGAFNNWSGINFFAWNHGGLYIGDDGWAKSEVRTPAGTNVIGEMQSDGMMIDHLRTAGILYKRGLVGKSSEPVVMYVDEPYWASNYSGLMAPKYQPKSGWQDIHSIRKAFGTVPASQRTATWMTTSPSNVIVSDNGEIIRDVQRKQLTVSAPQAEAFSGNLDSLAPAGIRRIEMSGTSGFATVILVSNDENSIETSRKLIISRTGLDSSNLEINGPSIKLKQMMQPTQNTEWQVKVTRPKAQAGTQKLNMSTPGELVLPSSIWYECELTLVDVIKTDSLGFVNSQGSPINNIIDANGKALGKITLTNNSLESKQVSIVMALYKDNKLSKISVEKPWLTQGSNTITHSGLDIPSDGGNYRVKLYIWNNTIDCLPLSDSAELK